MCTTKYLFVLAKMLLLIGFFSFEIAAQPKTFLKTYNSGNCGFSVREVNSNSYAVAGGTGLYYNYHFFMMSPIVSTNVHLFKANVDGLLMWEKIFSNPGSRTLATWMELTQDSGFILTGHMNQDVIWPPDSNDIFLMKTDSSGTIQWSKKLDTGKDELAYCVRQTNDGGYIVSGFHDALPVSLAGATYAMLTKTDSNGNVLWNKKYSLAVRDLDTGEALVWVVRQTADGGYVLVGTTAGSHAADLYVIRTDSNGDLVWAKSYEHDNSSLRFSMGLDILESLSGDFVIAGSLDKDQTLTQYNYPYILKISSTGTLITAKFFDSVPVQVFQSGFSSVEQTPDGGFFFTGMGGYGGFGDQAQLLKTDVDFNMQWSRQYSFDGIATMGSRSGRSTSDGCYVFTGKRQFAGTALLKTDPFGLVPCKSPGTLVELVPSILEVNRFPSSLSGINASNVPFITLPGLVDTTTVCPLSLAILPVELLSFTASPVQGNQVAVDWQTASEINNDYFLVEKSVDGNNFTGIGIVKGSGNSTETRKYRLLDENLDPDPILYYRLEQFDFDGNNHFSKVIPVRIFNEDLKIVSIQSDWYSQKLTINIQCNSTNSLSTTLTDMLGRTISLKSYVSGNGMHSIYFPVQTLSRGVYVLTLSDGLTVLSRKLIW